jgi:pilus assembly protein CpaC
MFHQFNFTKAMGFVLLLSLVFVSPSNAQSVLVPTTMEPYRLEIIAGKSLVMKLAVPLKKKFRVSVGSPEIADCLVLPPDEIYINGKVAGVTNMILWQEGELVGIYDIEVKYDIARLKEQLNEILPREEELMVTATNKSITLMGKVSNSGKMSQALVLAQSYAPEGKVNNLLQVGGTHQIMLEVKMAELSRSVGKELGIDLLYENGSTFGLVNLSSLVIPEAVTAAGIAGSLSPAINSMFRFNSGSSTWTGFINALQEDGLAKVIAEPTLIALSGQSASFLAGGEFPIPVPNDDGITIEYKEFGVGLSFSPTVLSEDKISIEVNSEVSELDFTTAVQYTGYIIPGITTRKAATTIELGDGQSFAIAGLLSENIRENVKKFPFLGDIPLLGSLFKSTEFQKDETELVIIVTPHFVKPLDKANQPLPTDSYQEPGDAEIYFNLKKSARQSPGQEAVSGETDGQFGHSFEKD